MIGPCIQICENKNSEGYCQSTACINPKYNNKSIVWTVNTILSTEEIWDAALTVSRWDAAKRQKYFKTTILEQITPEEAIAAIKKDENNENIEILINKMTREELVSTVKLIFTKLLQLQKEAEK